MIQITDKEKCCGCTACYSICPKKCIEMKPDEEGFLYPVVNTDQCVGCGACDKVCPVQNTTVKTDSEKKSYIARAREEEIVLTSSSGGLFTPIANYVLNQNGVICGATFDDDFDVVHKCLDSSSRQDELKKYRGSKYVQSYMGDNYKLIREELINNKLVCFSGTPCQVAGLKKYLNKEYDNLLTVDLVCHGTPSPKVWTKYLEYQKNKHKASVEDISFRNKTFGYHSGTMRISFDNGKNYYGSARVDFMLKAFFKGISSRPCCYTCAFKNTHHVSDLTIYDCWHPHDLVQGLIDDDKGYTNVIVQSTKGEELLRRLQDRLVIYEVDTQKAIQLDGVMINNSAKKHIHRDQFFNDIDALSIDELTDKYIKVSQKDHVIESAKATAYRLGILDILKKLLK